ncbi:hypothetical protein B0T19DRAFT_361924 [Cercophora scortea]|uniref:Jacalin-type lectin domain-containing protein n=1 Tax=Cercophora scortea TaxID=314031 RepID=A0AAE0M5A5_9PEZI|nr:hypothetical protein B0T19DRAFT_361924 [Cercophora scortea]
MAVLLAPYSRTIRLGQGFNSYLQIPCMDGAVDISTSRLKKAAPTNAAGPGNSSQAVTYSTRIADKISDVVRGMNISPASCIKSGTVESLGNSLVVDEARFATSDINIVVSVRVINHMSTSSSDAKFMPPLAGDLDSKRFFEMYGDCYVSGLITGGDLHGVVSIKALDAVRKDQIVSMLETQPNGNSLMTPDEEEPNEYSFLARGSETNIAVHWSGGGKIKLDTEQWTLSSLLEAAAAFPTRVAECPQRTWAILTRYDSNKSFVEWAAKANIQVPRFDVMQPFPVMQYTYDLLDDYVRHKANLRRLQAAVANPDDYEPSITEDSFHPIDVKALLEQQTLIKEQMLRISSVVTELNLDPTHAPETELKPPESWTTRLPVSFPPADICVLDRPWEPRLGSPLSSLSPEDDVPSEVSSAPRSDDEPAESSGEGESATEMDVDTEGTEEQIVPHICASEYIARLNDSEKAFVTSAENIRLYKHLRFAVAVNGRDTEGEAFNDAFCTTATIWPESLEILIGSTDEDFPRGPRRVLRVVLKYAKQSVILCHGENRGASRETLTMELAPGEMIRRLHIGKARGIFSARGLEFFEASTTHGKVISFGHPTRRDRVEYYGPPEGFAGLKGFWGAVDDGMLCKLAPIWG